VDARWLIEAKFAPPTQSRRHIERIRILDRLAPQANRLIVIQAAAGFGKSTLLAQWANRLIEAGTLVAWLNLDEDDRQSEPFVTYLVETLRRSLATVSGGAAAFGNYAGLPARGALSAIISELGRRNRPIALVLDDFHRAESDEIDAIVRLFLDRAPGCVSVALATRSPPRLGLARLKADRRVTMIVDRDLRFNEGETSLFFAAKTPRLDHADWLRFVARAEGWPVALQFARMLLDEGGALSALSAASEANDLGAYLSEQVFHGLTPQQQDFLLRTSPLETICEESAAAIGVERAGARVREFARSALPVVILSQEPLRFRYHHLLQDFLISRARDSAIDLLDIHRRAARWLASSGDLASAVRHALAGADAPSAADIIEKAGGWRLVLQLQVRLD
jgi:LuxR family transcriptional regulator, maltose regulon positive regulatory protein